MDTRVLLRAAPENASTQRELPGKRFPRRPLTRRVPGFTRSRCHTCSG